MMADNPRPRAENLWALREQKKISVALLANRAGLPIGLVMEYESGQKSIDPRHLARLARALYVDDTDIKLQSDPRPGAAPLQRQLPGDAGGREQPRGVPTPTMRERPARPPRPAPSPRAPLPARPSQFAHLNTLLKRLGRSEADLVTEIGKPLAELDRPALSGLLRALQTQVQEAATATRHRAYLPEAVDQFEARYLAAAQEAGDPMQLTLFDGRIVEGRVIGFGQYNITIRQEDGSELTVNKLALVSYRRRPARP